MSGAFVQATQGAQTAAGSSVSSSAFSGAVVAGNAIPWIAVYFDGGGTHLITVTRFGDSSIIQAGTFGSGTGVGGAYGVIENAGAGTTPVVASFGGSGQTFLGVHAMEYSGFVNTGTLFQAGERNSSIQASPGTGADGLTSGLITPGAQPFSIIGWSLNPNSSANVPTAGTGFNSRASAWATLGEALRPEDKVGITSLSPLAATFTAATNSIHLTIGMLLREVIPVAPIPKRRPQRIYYLSSYPG